MIKKRLVLILFFIFYTFSLSFSSNIPEPVKVVEGLHGLLIKSMKEGNRKSCKDRYKLLFEYIENSFDFPMIAKLVLGRRHWSKLDKKGQREFINAFTKMTVATYASRFDSYSGEKFITKKYKKNKRGHYVISAVLKKKDGEEIDFRYLCRKVDGKWKIVSVSAKGVNDLSVKRADYNSFLKKHSLSELINKINQKAEPCLNGK